MAGVKVVAPARLHLGFLDLNGSLGRRFGSIGLALDKPLTEIVVRRAESFAAKGPERERERAVAMLQRFAASLGLPGRYAADLASAIPAHAGLGSGTQLACAIGTALVRLEGLNRTPAELGAMIERGARSAIGMASFEGGGFIIDGGRGNADHPPPVIVQTPFPESWRALLVLDPDAEGVHGERETTAFAKLPEFPESTAAHLCRLTLMRLLPGIVEADIAAFGAALTEIQAIVGGHFAAAQGGSPWSSPRVGRLIARMAEAGAEGIGQSSWGPTGFAFVASEDAAQRLYQSHAEEARAEGVEILIVKGRNNGASIEMVATADLNS